MIRNKYSTIVVGAGIGGLTAAVYLTKNKIDTLLIDKNEKPGGLVNTFIYNGFKFDGGARAFENSGVIFPMLKQLGIDIDFVHNPVSVGIGTEVIDFISEKSLKDYENLLCNAYPDNTAEIALIIKEIDKVIGYMSVIYGIDNPMFTDKFTDKEYVFKELLPWLIKYNVNIKKAQKLNQPVEEYLHKFTDNQSLIDIIIQHFFKDTPTFFALSYFGQYLDYSYPLGGTGVLADKMAEYITKGNNNILTEYEVISVDVKDKKITLNDNQIISYDYLIWAADLRILYSGLDVSKMSGRERDINMKTRKKVFNGHGSDSILSVFIGTDLNTEYFKGKIKGHCFYTPDKKGLSTSMMRKWEDVLKQGSKEDEFIILQEITKEYLSLTTYEISIPSLRDESMSPPGKTGVIVSTLMDYNIFKYLKENNRYEKFKEYCTDIIVEVLDKSIFPGIKEKTTFTICATPLTIEKATKGLEGSITGWSYSNDMPVKSDLKEIISAPVTNIKDVYKAGQWAFYPSGVPTCIITGKLAADKVIKKSGKKL
ncbi:MAG: protoporphyrinogen oxidase [Firmicutes bacterium ADurb.Bin146]|nr:MAG: protoporphyrinogen oxidase [Firmicutes bacterium ADurb.Bin146]